jgi:hypothetical protein
MCLSKDGEDRKSKFVDFREFKGWHCSVNWFFMHIEQQTDSVFHHQTCQAQFGQTRGPIGKLSEGDKILAELKQRNTPIKQIHYYDVKQSMRNGGGPACLRLRVALSEQERQAVNPNVLMNEQLFATLNTWVDKHYRDEISEADLADPQLLQESRTALDELTQLLKLGSVYQFQR